MYTNKRFGIIQKLPHSKTLGIIRSAGDIERLLSVFPNYEEAYITKIDNDANRGDLHEYDPTTSQATQGAIKY